MTLAAVQLRAYIESDREFIDAHRKPLIALVEIAMSARCVPFPAWLRIEQGAQSLVFVALAWMLTRPALE